LAGLFPLLGALISLVIACLLHAEADHSWARLLRPLGILVVLHSAHTALFSLLWLRYRRFEAPEGAVWPTVSVIIPAFNEGPMVERSIRSAALSDYPRGALELIIVDDGSRDDTFFHMRHLRREFPELVRLVRFRGNRGKRAALLEGF
jgi:hyaluronan synthase